MGDENPNAQVEANLLEGKNRYASPETTLQEIKHDLDSTAAGLQSSWLGGASQGYQDKYGKLNTTVQSASDVLQKGSISIGKMHDSYIEADERQKLYKQVNGVLEKFMGVFMLFTAALGVVGAFLELADVAFAAEIGALEAAVEVGDVATDVTADVGIEEVDTLSSLDNVSNIDPLAEENPVPVDTPSEVPPEEAPVEPPQEAPVEPSQEAPADPPQDTPVEDPQDTPVEDPQTPVDQPSEEPAPETSKHNSAIDLSNDDKESLGKLDESTVSETPKEIAPQEPVQVQTVFGGPSEAPKSFKPFQPGGEPPEDSPLASPHDTPEASEEPDVTVGDDGTITKTTTTQEPDGGTTTVTETTAPNQTYTYISATKNAKGGIIHKLPLLCLRMVRLLR